MSLKPREQVEKSVLKRLRLHARSGVLLQTGPDSCLDFLSPTPEMLAECVVDMFRRNLFRIIPVPGSGDGILSPVGALLDSPPAGWRDSARRMLGSGVTVMITAEGIRRLEELKRSTTEIRKELWKRAEVDDGAEWTGKVQER